MKLLSWEIFLLHPGWGYLEHAQWAFCNTRHAHWVVRWGMRGKWGMLENARQRWGILLKLTAKPIIKTPTSHDLCAFGTLMLLQTECLEHICIIVQFKRCTAKDKVARWSELQMGQLTTIVQKCWEPLRNIEMQVLISCHQPSQSEWTMYLRPN
jgi:hypothetical protein